PLSMRPILPFAMTDLRRLPDGDLLTLERRYEAGQGVGVQLRRIPRASVEAVAAGGPRVALDGEIVASFDESYQIDNMEGLAVRAGDRGEVLVYTVSDDNFNRSVQSTLLLMYELLP
ncbi:MAG: esterase-like activity of phytase family protein, partial [Candidatus Binatia bacterium]